MTSTPVGTGLRTVTDDLELELQPSDPALTLGRNARNDVATNNPLVSSKHARVYFSDGSWYFQDAGSTNGSFVDGQIISSLRLDRPCEIYLGDPQAGEKIRFEPLIEVAESDAAAVPGTKLMTGADASTLRARARTDAVFAVQELTVDTNGTRRLDQVSFALPQGEMLGILGGSGAGKTTLVQAITGSHPATSGRVLFEGQDLYRNFAHLRRRLGYVPQDDILHPSLTVAETLHFAARLRMPDASPHEREERATQVLDELGIVHRAEARVSELSGGQRKRVNVAVELLSRPALLLLDEPTSGLDPANERSLMKLLRELADGGRTVIVVTHNTESLHLVDEVLVLARGGVPVFFGDEDDFAKEYEQQDLVDAFAFVDSHPNPSELRGHVIDEEREALGVSVHPDREVPRRASLGVRLGSSAERNGRDTWTLFQRSYRMLRGDDRTSLLVAVQAPVLAVLIIAVLHGSLLRLDPPNPQGATLLLVLVLSVTFLGATSTVREIVKERSIRLREQAIGVSTTSYLAAKTLLWGSINLVQSSLLVLVTTLVNDGPEFDLLGLGAANEVLWIVILTGLVAVNTGLLISALVRSQESLMTALPVYLFCQLLFSGLVVPVHNWPLRPLSWPISAKWGLDGVGAIGQLNILRAQECRAKPDDCSASWDHLPHNAVIPIVMLTLFVFGTATLTYHLLARTDPSRALERQAPT